LPLKQFVTAKMKNRLLLFSANGKVFRRFCS